MINSNKTIGNPANPISATNKNSVWFVWIFALFLNGLFGFVFIKMHEQLLGTPQEQFFLYLFAPFAIIGLWVIYRAIKDTRILLKFGNPVLIPSSTLQLGKAISGSINLPLLATPQLHATIKLTCVHHYLEQTSDGLTTRTEPVWQESCTVTPKLSAIATRIDFSFMPPIDLPATDKDHRWTIEVRIPFPGMSFAKFYELPVAEAITNQAEINEYVATAGKNAVGNVNPDTQTSRNFPEISLTSQGTQFYFRQGRHKSFASLMLVFGLVFCAISGVFVNSIAAMLPIAVWVISTYAVLIGLSMIAIAIIQYYSSLTVLVDHNGIEKRQYFFGYSLQEQLAVNDIVDITVKKSGLVTSADNNSQIYYNLVALAQDGQSINVGDNIDDYKAAQYLRKRILEALGKSWQPEMPNNDLGIPPAKFAMPKWLSKFHWGGVVVKYLLFFALAIDIVNWLLAQFKFTY